MGPGQSGPMLLKKRGVNGWREQKRGLNDAGILEKGKTGAFWARYCFPQQLIVNEYMNMKQPYEAPSIEVLYLKAMQDVLTVSGGEFDEDEDDIFNN